MYQFQCYPKELYDYFVAVYHEYHIACVVREYGVFRPGQTIKELEGLSHCVFGRFG